MKLVTFDESGALRFGLVVDGGIADATGWLPGVSSLRQVLLEGRLRELEPLSAARPDHAVDEVRFLPPIPDPQRIVCVGINYDAHRIETDRKTSSFPTLFIRWPSSLVGHQRPLLRPVASERFDFEGELAVVIGRPARRVSREDAMTYVAGYSCFLDGSVRDFQRHTSQFTPGKNFDESGGFGPWLTTADEVGDPSKLHLQTRLNGQTVQSAPTRDLIFDVPRLIEYISTFTTLEPGDVIATGTPGGVGDRRNPPLYLKDGDRLEVEVLGVGRLEHPIVDEAQPSG